MMKRIICLALCLFVYCSAPVFAAEGETVIGTISTTGASVTKTGDWKAGALSGYNGTDVLEAEANEDALFLWKINTSMGQGTFRLLIWHSISENGCENAQIAYSSEFQNETVKKINQREGNSGWLEVGIYSISGAGSTVKLTGRGGVLLANAIKFEKLDSRYESLATLFGQMGEGIVLQADSKNTYVNGLYRQIADVTPTIIADRTQVPVRFVTESLGAKVNWDAGTNKARVALDGKILEFTQDSDIYTSNGQEKKLEHTVVTISDRIMLPLRVMAEEFGYKVYWHDSGLIVISAEDVNVVLSNEKIRSDVLSIMDN